MIDGFTKAKYIEWQASLWGASFIAFALGALLYQFFPQTLLYIVILVGIVMHSWGMYQIHLRNK
jgi:hypothetical protein